MSLHHKYQMRGPCLHADSILEKGNGACRLPLMQVLTRKPDQKVTNPNTRLTIEVQADPLREQVPTLSLGLG